MITFEDCQGRVMQPGDKIIYTLTSEGAGSLFFGEVLKFTPKSFYVKRYNSDWTVQQHEKIEKIDTGEKYQWGGTKYEYVHTGQMVDYEPRLIPYNRKERFYII